MALIDKAFLRFDKDGSGCINAADLKGVYNCTQHPKVAVKNFNKFIIILVIFCLNYHINN